MRGGTEKLPELSRCEWRLYNPVSDLGILPGWVGEDSENRGAFLLRKDRRLWVDYSFFSTTSKFTRVPGQTQVPFPPLRELITVCKVRPDHSSLQYKKWDLESPFMSRHRMLGGQEADCFCPCVGVSIDITDVYVLLQTNCNLLFCFHSEAEPQAFRMLLDKGE